MYLVYFAFKSLTNQGGTPQCLTTDKYPMPRSWPNLGSDTAYADIRFLMVGGVGISFGHYETDPDTGTQSWVPQYYRKYGSKSLGITIRQRFSTVDTPAP